MILVLCFSTVAFGYASEEDPLKINSDDVLVASGFLSEYDLIKDLQELSNADLVSGGYTEEEIEEIRNIDLDAYVDQALSVSDQELRSKGMTFKEISDFRKTAETDEAEAMRVLYKGVRYNVYLTPDQFYYSPSSNRTNLTFYMTWEWTSAPTARFTDIVALTTNDNKFIAKSQVTTVTYKYITAGTVAKTETPTTYTYGSKTATYSRFAMEKGYNAAKVYAASGRISTYFQAKGKYELVAFSGNYGHAKVSVTPSVSIGTGLAIGFTPETKVDFGSEAAGDTDS